MIAYLILAHDQPALLGRLARRIASTHAHVFVHVDAKADLAAFDDVLRDVPGCTRLQERFDVEWGGFSTVRATLALMKAARAAGAFRRYVLMSGVDYPVTSTEAREAILLDSDAEYIALERRLDAPEHKKRRRWVTQVHLHDTLFWPSLSRLKWLLPRRRYPHGLSPVHGSQWWALTDRAVGYVLDYVATHPDFLRAHRWMHHPCDILFHTLVAHSPFADLAANISTAPNVFGVHYVDWTILGPRPPVLTDAYLPTLLASGALFARKVQAGVSDTLLDALDQYIGP